MNLKKLVTSNISIDQINLHSITSTALQTIFYGACKLKAFTIFILRTFYYERFIRIFRKDKKT